MVFSTMSMTVTTVLMGFIIHFERDNHNRTLINQLVSSLMWCAVFWNVVMQPVTFIRYIIGPIDSIIFCGIETVLRNVLCMHALLLFDSIILVQYLFLFHLKNPTAVQDDFWKFLLNIWIFSACLLLQCVYMILPGKNPINFYMCVGKYPVRFQNIPVKMNISFWFLAMLSGFIHLYVGLFKIKYNQKNKANVDTKSLFNFTSNIVGTFTLLAFTLVTTILVNSKEPDDLDTFPNYILLYILHHFTTQFNLIVICITFYTSKALRTKFMMDLKVFLNVYNSSQTNGFDITT